MVALGQRLLIVSSYSYEMRDSKGVFRDACAQPFSNGVYSYEMRDSKGVFRDACAEQFSNGVFRDACA